MAIIRPEGYSRETGEERIPDDSPPLTQKSPTNWTIQFPKRRDGTTTTHGEYSGGVRQQQVPVTLITSLRTADLASPTRPRSPGRASPRTAGGPVRYTLYNSETIMGASII